MKRRVPIVVLTIVIALAAVFLPGLIASRQPARELIVVARGMTYYVNGAPTPNPDLQFVPGEEVHLVFRNEDKGMLHDFRIASWQVATGLVEGGREHSIEFTVPSGPDVPTTATYTCTPHAAMMAGGVTLKR